MRWGFVLDQDACIGCHACTVGCKAENDVPLGAFRTWVKWIEHGRFPDTSRAAAVLRCNHCADAPCVAICPTIALFQRGDGIVDLDADRCIGCASCMQACPYDAIYIDPREGTAAKCHFCAHRLEVDLAPACVSVCPEQAIKVVDLDDEGIRRDLGERGARRKPERGTQPHTWYLGADPAALDPLAVDGTRTLSHAEVPDPLPAPGTTEARAVYDIPRQRQWGGHIAAYLATKAVAAGALIAAALSPWSGALEGAWLGWLSLFFLGVTVLLLIGDLHQPRRFFFLLTKPNPGSWLVRGGWILTAHALVSLPWALGAGAWWWSVLAIPVAFATAIYTAFLFWQARGRELWAEDRFLPVVLAAQAGAAAAALGWFFGEPGTIWVLIHAAAVLAATFLRMPTPGARHGHALMLRQPAYAFGFVAAFAAIAFPPLVFVAFVALDWSYVRAGQEVPLS
jgi:Fe-S-cluster-containing dehydrogenase component